MKTIFLPNIFLPFSSQANNDGVAFLSCQQEGPAAVSAGGGTLTLSVTNFGVRPTSLENAVPGVKKALEACRQAERAVLGFPKGRYDFWAQHSDEIVEGKVFFHGEGWRSRWWGCMEFDAQTCIIPQQSGDSPLGDSWHKYTAQELGDALENLTWAPDFTVRNTWFGSCRARGLLVSTPGRVVIENNDFVSSGADNGQTTPEKVREAVAQPWTGPDDVPASKTKDKE